MDGSRDRMVASAGRLLSVDGLEGTSFSTVLALSGAPRGSIYHHFPEGKGQLIAEAVETVGSRVLDGLASLPAGPPADVIARFCAPWRTLLEDSGTRAGCAVAAVAVSGGVDLAPVAGRVFARWRTALARALTASGLPAETAARLATTALAAVEGALILSRASADIGAFDDVVSDLSTLAVALTPAP
jgi:AcrR family transcriptional regulator